MELRTALRTTGAIREFAPREVPDALVREVLDDARFAPSGGNRQAWRVVVVKDPALRVALRDLYVDAWRDYVAHGLARLTPFSPLATDQDRASALRNRAAAEALADPNGFPETLDRVPVLLALLADLGNLAALDRDLDRYQFVGGASIYPFAWNILLAARERGLGGVITTMTTRHEKAALQLFNAPENFALAGVLALGYPKKEFVSLRRRDVDAFTSVDRVDGSLL